MSNRGKKRTKGFALVALVALMLVAALGCTTTNANDVAEEAATSGGAINVISREDGSGTRSAFVELFGVIDKDKNDLTFDGAEITNSTSVMMTTVAGDPFALGYISLGSLNSTVKALEIDGVKPSAATVADGSYAISRPFNIATKGSLDAVTQDFIDFIMSTEGQDVVEEDGYIRIDDAGAFAGNKPSGKVVIAGSSSVTPVMEALKEAYLVVNPNAQIEIQQSDSTTGMNSVVEGICNIGMASRELKDSEIAGGLTAQVIALDGIAVIVNNDNALKGLTKDQVKDMYIGTITDWSEAA